MKIKIGESTRSKEYLKDKKLLIISIVCGLAAAIANMAFLSNAAGVSIKILKAKDDISNGTPVTRSMFDEITISGELNNMKSVFISAGDFSVFENRVLVEPLKKDEPLMLKSFNGGIKIDVPAGKRLVPIKVRDESQAVGYLISPGNSVDIHGWIDGIQQKLASRICVVAVGNLPYSPSEGEGRDIKYSSITVLVDEADVEHLNNNLHQAGEDLGLTLAGYCDPKSPAEILKTVSLTPVISDPKQQGSKATGNNKKSSRR